jgi:hypothetical protein
MPAQGFECGLGESESGVVSPTSRISHWQFFALPSADLREAGAPVYPQDYQCLSGGGGASWTFHLDTFRYTQGCKQPPDEAGIALRPCDAFLYAGAFTTPPIYRTYGKAFACGLYGKTVVGVVHGSVPVGVAVCAPPADASAFDASRSCGFFGGDPAIPLGARWQFTAVPMYTANIDSAMFDTNAGTACITADGQTFTFTLATRAFTAGCGGTAPGPRETP